MMANPKEFEHQYRMRRLHAFSVGWESLMRFLCVLVPCVTAYFCVREVAGRVTVADLDFKAFADLKVNHWFALSLPWVATSLATGWAIGERRLRKRHIKRVTSEASEMQKRLDPGRRSSSLSKMGDTSPEDI